MAVESYYCPRCAGRNVGRVGSGQFYCWDCFIEFAVSYRGIRMYQVGIDGELSRIDGDAASNIEGVSP